MTAIARTAVLALLTGLLCACQQDSKPAGKGAGGGEILPASTSDAMLPLDRLRSQPPLAPGAGKDAGGKDGAGKAGDAKKDGDGPKKPSPAPATTATATATATPATAD